MKTVAIDIFNMSFQVKSNKHKIIVLNRYKSQLEEIRKMGLLNNMT